MPRGHGFNLPLKGVSIWNPLPQILIKQIPRQARDDKVTLNMSLAVGYDSVIPSAVEESIRKASRSGSTLTMPTGHGFTGGIKAVAFLLVVTGLEIRCGLFTFGVLSRIHLPQEPLVVVRVQDIV